MRGRWRVWSVLVGALTVGTTAAGAQSPVKFGLGGGLAIPLGTFDDNDKLGWQGEALVTFRHLGARWGSGSTAVSCR